MTQELHTERKDKLDILRHSEGFKVVRESEEVYRLQVPGEQGREDGRFISKLKMATRGRRRGNGLEADSRNGFIVDYSHPSSVRVFVARKAADEGKYGIVQELSDGETFDSNWEWDELILFPFLFSRGLTEREEELIEKWSLRSSADEYDYGIEGYGKDIFPFYEIYHKDGRAFTRDPGELDIALSWQIRQHQRRIKTVRGFFEKLQRRKVLPRDYYEKHFIGFTAELSYGRPGRRSYFPIQELKSAYKKAWHTRETWEFISMSRSLGIITKAPMERSKL